MALGITLSKIKTQHKDMPCIMLSVIIMSVMGPVL